LTLGGVPDRIPLGAMAWFSGAHNEEKGEEKTLASLCRAAETRMHCQPRR
jgi:hypothetical protein